MPKKKLDPRVRTVIDNAAKCNHRCFFVVVGDKGRDQVVNLHYMIARTRLKARPSVLWCYKKELGFSSNKRKRMRHMKKLIQRGVVDPDTDDPFELFLSSTDIRYAYYSDSHKILGNTYGMLVLQDFEALTPNLLARTIETVEGGGMVVLLLRTMDSLRTLYSMTMDIHSRFRNDKFGDVVARFNERFLLSLSQCGNCLVVDDELNVLPISSSSRYIKPVDEARITVMQEAEQELKQVKESLEDTPLVGNLVACARTQDQAKAVLSFVEAISEKTLRNTVALTAARGRGKSAALGLAMAAAVAYGYSNIFVTSPSPENLKTLFEFIFKGFDALNYEEHMDYELVQSTNPDFHKAVVRVNIFRQHRQTIQYISPEDSHKLSHAELVVIDEAAAIPLPLVKKMLGPYLVFMASTINGYEGTGRSLSLKLIQQLRDQQVTHSSVTSQAASSSSASSSTRVLREIQLEEPIRYSAADPIEKWLYQVLCLDCVNAPKIANVTHPEQCQLYWVNRDTLFSFHPASELFLQRMMSLYVSSHYKNTPNDLQLMSDAPGHHLFVLLGSVSDSEGGLPDVLCVIQVAMEGFISRQSMAANMSRGIRPSGDLIPYSISQQFQDSDFGSLSGARVVRIASHPDLQGMGYGTRALQLLCQYYSGQLTGISVDPGSRELGQGKVYKETARELNASTSSVLREETLQVRTQLDPLLLTTEERPPERLHYVGVSFGLTAGLLKFWSRSSFDPVYLRLTQNDLTGEHTCIMLRALECSDLEEGPSEGWLQAYTEDFRRRLLSLLGYEFRKFSPQLSLSLLLGSMPISTLTCTNNEDRLTYEELLRAFSRFDFRRLESYSRNLVDYHVILDMLPTLARYFFLRRFPFQLTYTQAAILLSLGLQYKSVTEVESELGIGSSQVLALFNKATRKVSSEFRAIQEDHVAKGLPVEKEMELTPFAKSLEEDLLEEGASSAGSRHRLTAEQQQALESAELSKYAIAGGEEEWDSALQGGAKTPSRVSIKTGAKPKKGAKKRDAFEDLGSGGDSHKSKRPKKEGSARKNAATTPQSQKKKKKAPSIGKK